MTIATLLTPLGAASSWGKGAMIMLRIIIGIGAGVTFPCMHILISKWIPLEDRTKMANIIWSGINFGTIIGMPISGLLASNVNWQSIFYVFGGISCIWIILWIFLVSNSPADHPNISNEERSYIEKSLAQNSSSDPSKFPPFTEIFTTPAFLALIISHFGHDWGFYTLLTETPTYLNNVQHFSLTSVSLILVAF